ncbi:MAG: ABC transporter substrate-binding protein [Proteobacteria bacterium]|nr:ABC transporter substrate-binding protein [Pseudomonadota bacterium]
MRHWTAIGRRAAVVVLAALTTTSGVALAQDIVIGQTAPYSGPLSALSVVGNTHTAFFTRLNEQGGINGRKIKFLSVDDGYSPPKTVEMTRQLVERDNALIIFSSLGTPTSAAVHKYLNTKKVPQLFVASGASQWANPEAFPWTMGWQISYPAEARIFAKYVLDNIKDAKIAILSQNDDSGKDMVAGFKEGLGEAASRLIVRAVTYEVTDPTVDSQIFDLKATGANVFMNFATPKFAAQAIRRAHEAGWRPTQFVSSVSSSVATLKPAGAEATKGIIVTQFLKDPADAAWKDDPGVREYRAFLEKYYPKGNIADGFGTFAYSVAQTLVQTLRQCDGTITRERIMHEAANLKHLSLPLLLPGIEVNTGPTDFNPIKQARMARFTGETFELFGDVIDASMTRPAKK